MSLFSTGEDVLAQRDLRVVPAMLADMCASFSRVLGRFQTYIRVPDRSWPLQLEGGSGGEPGPEPEDPKRRSELVHLRVWLRTGLRIRGHAPETRQTDATLDWVVAWSQACPVMAASAVSLFRAPEHVSENEVVLHRLLRASLHSMPVSDDVTSFCREWHSCRFLGMYARACNTILTVGLGSGGSCCEEMSGLLSSGGSKRPCRRPQRPVAS